MVPVMTSQGVGCNEDLLLVWGDPLVSIGLYRRGLVGSQGLGCHSDTCLCCRNRGLRLVRHADRDLNL